MKRLVAILLAGVLTLGLAATVFAAPSQGGNATDAVISSVSGDITKADIEWTSDFAYSDADVLAAAGALGIDTTDVSVYLKGDLHMTDGSAFTGSATITFNGPKNDQVVAVLHYTGSGWEIVGSSEVATFTNGFSPVAILVKKTAAAPADDKKQDEQKQDEQKQDEQKQDEQKQDGQAQDNKSQSDAKSPQTGEAPFVAIMSVVAILAAAGIAVSRRKVSDR